MAQEIQNLISLGQQVVDRAKKAGANVAEAILVHSDELSAKVRMRELEMIEQAESHGIGLRVLRDDRAGLANTSDLSESGIAKLVEDAIALCEYAEPEPDQAPPPRELLATEFPDLDLFDASIGTMGAEEAKAIAFEAEAAALNTDSRINNSEGATSGRTHSTMALVTDQGFAQGYQSSFASVSVRPVADDAGGKKRVGSYWDAKHHREDLLAAADIGKEAGRRTLEKLGADKIESAKLPVVFDPDAGRALLSLLFSCVSGYAIYKKQSFLTGKMGEPIAGNNIHVVDDALIQRGPGSRPFDGEGLASRKNSIVKDGVLQTYVTDLYSGRKLSLPSTGNASRGIGGRPGAGATNFALLSGDKSPEDILAGVSKGLYVTSMMGFGFNAVTGDFSRGAEGFLIEDGKKTQPVSEITVSLNLGELLHSIEALGNDPDLRSRFVVPTILVKEMTIGGK